MSNLHLQNKKNILGNDNIRKLVLGLMHKINFKKKLK